MIVLFGSNYKSEGQTGEFACLALERMGHTVVPFTPSENPPDGWLKVAPDVDAVDFYNHCGYKADMFIMVESSVGSPFLPKNIADLPIPTAYWLYDNYLNFRWNKEVAALFDHCFFAQLNRVNLARKYGRDNVSWLPFAADEVCHRDFHLARDIDIGYLGSITPQKKKYFEEFGKSGLTVVTSGAMGGKFLSNEDVGRFYSRCKLVYNILARRDMNTRTFEAAYAGALVVQQAWIDEGCQAIFADGESMVFHNFEDAPAICRRLLANDAERERMAKNAQQIVTEAHTYRHRMRKVIDKLSRGVTEERMRMRSTFAIPVAEALTCFHRDFKWRERAREKLREGFSRSPVRVAMALVKFAWWRVKEKIEKIIWSIGKAPV